MNAIAKLRAKKTVTVAARKGITAVPYAALIAYEHGNDKGVKGFFAKGLYYYETGEGYEKQIVEMDAFSRFFNYDAIDAMFTQMNIQYPEGATYSEQRILEVQKGLFGVVVSEGNWGLTAQDWEIIEE